MYETYGICEIFWGLIVCIGLTSVAAVDNQAHLWLGGGLPDRTGLPDADSVQKSKEVEEVEESEKNSALRWSRGRGLICGEFGLTAEWSESSGMADDANVVNNRTKKSKKSKKSKKMN